MTTAPQPIQILSSLNGAENDLTHEQCLIKSAKLFFNMYEFGRNATHDDIFVHLQRQHFPSIANEKQPNLKRANELHEIVTEILKLIATASSVDNV